MKLLRLDLIAVGPFTDVQLDFAAGDCGLHLVYGPNEAGKSSSLRALQSLLYGFHPKTSDDFRHSYNSLRVGGLFQKSSGELFACVRRKGNKNTLLDGDGSQAIEESCLRQMLAGVEEDQFRQRFGLGHEQLRAGCESLRAGEGDLAEALFSAGAGLGDVHRVVEAIRKEAAEIYKPSGRNQAIPQAIEEWNRAESQVRDCLESAPAWKQKEAELAGLRARLEEIEAEIARCAGQSARLDRIRSALPMIAQRRHLQQTLSELGETPLLVDDFDQRRIAAITQLEEAMRGEEQLRAAITKTEEQLESCPGEPVELAREQEITHLHRTLGAFLEGQGDRPGLEARLDEINGQSRHLLSELGHASLPFAEASKLHISKLQRDRIGRLASDQKLGESQLAALTEQVEECAAEMKRLEKIASAGEPPATDALAELVQETRSAGDLERQLDDCTAAVGGSRRQLANRLKRFTPWEGTVEELAEAAVPSDETIRRFEHELGAAAEAVASSQAKLCQVEESLDAIEAEIESLARRHQTPSADDLAEARNVRDQSWRMIRGRWLREPLEEPPAAPAADGELAHQFEAQSQQADLLGDRLRREAEQVAQKADKLAQRERLLGQRERLERLHREAVEAQEAAQQAWRDAWSSAEIAPLLPREMLVWTHERAALLDDAEQQARQAALARRVEEQITSLRERLLAALQSLGQPGEREHAPLSALLRRAEACLKQCEEQRLAHREACRDYHKATATLAARQRKLEELKTKCKENGRAWRESLTQFDIPPAASPDEAEGLLKSLDEFFRLRREAEELTARVAGIDSRSRQFAASSLELARHIDKELAALSPAEIAQQLQHRLKTAHQSAARTANLQQQLAGERQRLESIRDNIRQHRAALHTLCQEARCQEHERLGEVAQASRNRRQAETDLAQLEIHLSGLAQEASLEEFIAQASGEQADQLPAEVDRLQSSLKSLQAQRDELLKQIDSLEKVLAGANGGDRAAVAAEEAKAALAKIGAHAENYARLKLAESILARAMQCYRQQNEGPIVQRASEYFALLTLNSFAGLESDWTDDGHTVLVGVRPGGRARVRIDGMSSGSTDQLYLALRLASLEHHLKHREALPLVVDDILIHFDDARATAALRALAEVSRRTQVIMFTHHSHLVDLARETLDAETLFVQELPFTMGHQSRQQTATL